MKSIKIWKDILDFLQNLTVEQLSKEVQYIEGTTDYDKSIPLGSVIAIGTVEDMFKTEDEENNDSIIPTRSSYDNKHHPEDIVLLVDYNLFNEDGSFATDLITGEKIFPKNGWLFEIDEDPEWEDDIIRVWFVEEEFFLKYRHFDDSYYSDHEVEKLLPFKHKGCLESCFEVKEDLTVEEVINLLIKKGFTKLKKKPGEKIQ